MKTIKRCLLALAYTLALTAGCAKQKAVEPEPAPDYGRLLPPGESALRLVTDPSRMPDFTTAYENRDALLLQAIDESLVWFEAPSSQRHFPFESITHEQASASLIALRELLEHSPSDYAFKADLERMFDVYESVGYNGRGTVLFTGYFAPEYRASRTRTARFDYPLYQRPADLMTDPMSGEPQGRRMPDGSIAPYATRREIDESGMLAGSELVWLEDALSAYLIHVNGSAKLRMSDGSIMYIGYAGKTDRPYASLGKAMLDAGLLEEGKVNLASIRAAHRRNPRRVHELMYRNESYVFFREYNGSKWPAGSLGVRVTPESTLATSKKIYPRGGAVLVDTNAITFTGGKRPFQRFMLDQDTGGAFKAPGRADIFMGIGNHVEILAGGQYAEGRLYYLFLKPEYLEQYADAGAALGSR